ncbi:general odorant-binding protein 56d-like [Bombyx mandarina]|uniref:Odorant binding protein n=2 Tax=Bombyx TaxID=7090 RepID=A0A8R1XGK1_BOMMO|nr:general odorant-binding protein 56d [Bombyx mori]XP_028028047.1 general odorant-binding protein 56d-like [Bombyx mandarina]
MIIILSYSQNVHLAETQKEKAKQYTSECVRESGVSTEAINAAKIGKYSKDKAFKNFVLCFFKKSAIFNSDGTLNMDVALAKLPPGVNKSEAQSVLKQCKNKTGQGAADKAFEIFRCYYKGTKTHILF